MRKTLLIILVFVILSASVYLFLNQKPTGNFIYDDDVEVSVNGDKITSQDVNDVYDKIPEEIRLETSKKDVLDDLIDQKLLLQEAEDKGIYATEEEVDNYLEQIKLSTGVEGNFEKIIADAGFTLEDYKESLKELITVSKLLDEVLDLQNVNVTDAEVNDYISANQDLQQISEDEIDLDFLTVRIRQKLILDKQQELVDNYIQSLKDKAEIEIRGGIVSD